MIADGLVSVLNGLTDIPFEEIAWSEAPETKYGVVTVDGQSEFKADADPVAEKMRTGYVDVFVKPTDPDPTDDVEAAMQALELWFSMEQIQYEPETGWVHIEWRWTDVMNTSKINMNELPIMLHVVKTEEVQGGGGQTYRKVTFADGETDKILRFAESRDMCFMIEHWNSHVLYQMRKASVREQGTTVEVAFVGTLPSGTGDEEYGTITGFAGIKVLVFFHDGVFHSALATYFTSQ